MIQFFKSEDVPFIIEAMAEKNISVWFPEISSTGQSTYGGAIDSYWWHLSESERSQFQGLEHDGPAITEWPELGPDLHVPVELAMAISTLLIEQGGYISEREALRNQGMPATYTLVYDAFDALYAGNDMFGLKSGLEELKVGKAQLKNKALWWLGMKVKSQGSSNFTNRARQVLEEGLPDFHVLAYLAWKITPEQLGDIGLKLPARPLQAEPSKTTDIPGVWQIRKCNPFSSFYGDKVFYICANETNQGVCFSIPPESHLELNAKPGDLVSIRAGILGLDESKKYLKLERVQIKKYA